MPQFTTAIESKANVAYKIAMKQLTIETGSHMTIFGFIVWPGIEE